MENQEENRIRMGSEVGVFAAPATPASVLYREIAEHIGSLMAFFGIELIESRPVTVGASSHLYVDMVQFPDAPEEIRAQGMVAKDALAKILSVANIMRFRVKPTDEGLEAIRGMWAYSTEEARKSNASSTPTPQEVAGDDSSHVPVGDATPSASEASVPEKASEELICIRS